MVSEEDSAVPLETTEKDSKVEVEPYDTEAAEKGPYSTQCLISLLSLHDLNQALFKTAAIRECPFHIYPWLSCLCVAMHDISVVPNRKLSNISLYFVSVFSINA